MKAHNTHSQLYDSHFFSCQATWFPVPGFSFTSYFVSWKLKNMSDKKEDVLWHPKASVIPLITHFKLLTAGKLVECGMYSHGTERFSAIFNDNRLMMWYFQTAPEWSQLSGHGQFTSNGGGMCVKKPQLSFKNSALLTICIYMFLRVSTLTSDYVSLLTGCVSSYFFILWPSVLTDIKKVLTPNAEICVF